MTHPNSLNNLKLGEFKKGHKSAGRPKGAVGVKTHLKHTLERLSRDGHWASPVAERLVTIALSNPKKVRRQLGITINTEQILKAIKQILDRMEGRPKETVTQDIQNRTELVFTGFEQLAPEDTTPKNPLDVEIKDAEIEDAETENVPTKPQETKEELKQELKKENKTKNKTEESKNAIPSK